MTDYMPSRIDSEFMANVRKFWKSNVKKYFSKREKEYGLDPKLTHRFILAPFSDKRDPRLVNALVVKWSPGSNHITVNVAPIMVKSVSDSEHYAAKVMKAGTRTMTGEIVKPGSVQRAYDLIEILRRGTSTSPKRWVASIDRRVQTGSRGPQSNDQWREWFTIFISKVDQEIERLADRMAEKIATEEFY